MSNTKYTYSSTYRRLTNWWPLPPPQHIADAVAAGVVLDEDWTAEIEQLRTSFSVDEVQEATDGDTRT